MYYNIKSGQVRQLKKFLTTDKSEVLRYMGYGGQPIDSELERDIAKGIKRCSEVSFPAYTYGYFDTEQTEGGVMLAGCDIVLPGNDIKAHLKGAKYCAVMAVTLGMSLERELILAEKKSMTDAIILDSAANAYIESAADYVEGIIIKESREKGFYTNFRYSPGYGDFPIEAQKKLIPMLQCEKRIGLTVTQSSIMIPRKSVTAVIGIFDKKQNHKKSCEGCNMYDSCSIRKGGERCDKQLSEQ